MRIAVTGSRGQVAMSLIERANPDVEIVPLSRPAFALEERPATAVDRAEADFMIPETQ